MDLCRSSSPQQRVLGEESTMSILVTWGRSPARCNEGPGADIQQGWQCLFVQYSKDGSKFLLECCFWEPHLCHEGRWDAWEPGPSRQGWPESVERLHLYPQSAGAEEQLPPGQGLCSPVCRSPHHSLLFYILCSSFIVPVLLLQNSCLLFSPTETKHLAS